MHHWLDTRWSKVPCWFHYHKTKFYIFRKKKRFYISVVWGSPPFSRVSRPSPTELTVPSVSLSIDLHFTKNIRREERRGIKQPSAISHRPCQHSTTKQPSLLQRSDLLSLFLFILILLVDFWAWFSGSRIFWWRLPFSCLVITSVN